MPKGNKVEAVSENGTNYMQVMCNKHPDKACGSVDAADCDSGYCEGCLFDTNKNPIQYSFESAGWQTCPKCCGQGTVSKPPYVPGDVFHWSGCQTAYQCDVCKGKKIINTVTGLPPMF